MRMTITEKEAETIVDALTYKRDLWKLRIDSNPTKRGNKLSDATVAALQADVDAMNWVISLFEPLP